MKRLLLFFKDELHLLLLALASFATALAFLALELHVPYTVMAVLATLLAGAPVFADAVRGLFRRDLLDEKFLMSIASLGALLLGDLTEAAAVMIFYQIGEFFQRRAVARSRRSVRALMDIRPDTATVIREGKELSVDADDVAVGECVCIRTGERVPLDATVLSGHGALDTSALTGEAMPRAVREGDTVESGCVLLSGVLVCRTLRCADASAAARILELVECASENKAKEERFITKFSRVYTPCVVGLALALACIVPLFDGFAFLTYIKRALTFLVISCPCALVISVPMAFFGGIGGAASQGILFKGGHVFSPLCRVKTAVFDKTGTLTHGGVTVSEVVPAGVSAEELLSLAAFAEYGSNHPVAKCLKHAVKAPLSPPVSTEEYSGLGVIASDGVHTLAVGNRLLMQKNGIETPENVNKTSQSVLYVAKDGVFVGSIYLCDDIKEEAASALRELRRLGVSQTVMLTGDTESAARHMADVLSLDGVHAGLLPHEKYARLETLIETSGGSVMYVGDGINDAPSIARADIGVAMGGIGQDSAIEAADVVLMSDALDRLPLAIRIARRTLRIAKENIVFALGVKLAVLVLGALGFASMWLAVFADVGVAVLAILNAMRALYVPR